MSTKPLHQCQCSVCQKDTANATKQVHAMMNLLLSRLDEEQQRLYVGLEARRRGSGSEHGLSFIIGWTEDAIAVARREAERAALAPDDSNDTQDCQSLDVAFRGKLAKAVALDRVRGKTPYSNQSHWKK